MTEKAGTVTVPEQGCITVEDNAQGMVVSEAPVHTATTVEVHSRIIQAEQVVSVVAVGQQGPRGPRPEHQWDGTKLRFQNPDGSWGDWVEMGTSISDAVIQAYLAARGIP